MSGYRLCDGQQFTSNQPISSSPTPRNIDDIRKIMTSFAHKKMTSVSHPLEYRVCLELLSFHPTWSKQLDNIMSVWITSHPLDQDLMIMKLSTETHPKYRIVSWRQCALSNRRINQLKMNQQNKPSSPPHTTATNIPNENELNNNTITTVVQSPNLIVDDSFNEKKEVQNQMDAKKQEKFLIGAMRHAVHKQIRDWAKQHMFHRQCRTCASVFRLQVDHIEPFKEIRQDFFKQCEDKKIQLPQKFLFAAKTSQPKFHRQDRSFKLAWQRFHKSRAFYQWLCRTCNTKKGGKKVHTNIVHKNSV